jgi:hypothetical protein
LVTAALASSLMAAPAWGQGAADGDAYGTVLERMVAGADGAARSAQARPGSGPALYIDLRRPTDSVAGFSTLDAGDRALLEAAKRTFEVFQALGGRTDHGVGVVQRDGSRIYVGLDGDGGRWFTSSAAATAYLLQRLLARSDLPAPAAAAATGCQDLSCVVQVARREVIKTEAIAPRGTTIDLDVRTAGLSAAPVVSAPAGFTVHEATASSDRVRVRLTIPAATALGASGLYVFSEGRPFRPVGAIDLRIVGSIEELEALAAGRTVSDLTQVVRGGTLETIADDHAGSAAGATPLAGTTSGVIETAGDVDMFRVVLGAPGPLTITSSGPTDVAATLLAEDGSTVASDDDSGPWYNFALTKVLPAGTYYLAVRHCCNGTGRYSLSVGTTGN